MFANLETSWSKVLDVEKIIQQDYMQKLWNFLAMRHKSGKIIYPKNNAVFNAFKYTPFEKVKVVILGQDPYHRPDQAHGLSFSVPHGVTIPPSLVNIYKELQSDLGITPANHGYLEAWASQGVLLLNSVLTVEQGEAGAHQKQGWEQFTDAVIAALNARAKPVIFLLWGSYAQNKCQQINNDNHLVLKAPHPSPLSAYRGFLGCKHFSQVNKYLSALNESEINWQLPE